MSDVRFRAKSPRPISDAHRHAAEEVMSPDLCRRLGLPKGSRYAELYARIARGRIVRKQDMLALKEVTDRIEGKPRQSVDFSAREPITVHVVYDDAPPENAPNGTIDKVNTSDNKTDGDVS